LDNILDPILHSPRLKEYLNELSSYIRNEEEKREGFYATITEQEKAEFINGEVIFHSPVIRKHNQITGKLFTLLNVFVSAKDLGFVGFEKILIKLSRNDFEPDVCFFRKEVADTFSDKTMFFPAPDFIAEIFSKSTQAIDRGVKFEDYAFHGVKEYWIIDADNETVEQYLLNDEKRYELFVKLNEGTVYCKTVSVFNIPVRALFDETIYNDTLKQMI
jgi:Uma2 family endonuclease